MLTPPFSWRKADFDTFQKVEFPSGLVATPTSPIPPARASGPIRKNGTAVVTTLIDWLCCAPTYWAVNNPKPVKRLKRVDLMNLILSNKCRKRGGFPDCRRF